MLVGARNVCVGGGVIFLLVVSFGRFSAFYVVFYDLGRMGRFTRNILQWSRNSIKSTSMTTGDCSVHGNCHQPNIFCLFMEIVTKHILSGHYDCHETSPK